MSPRTASPQSVLQSRHGPALAARQRAEAHADAKARSWTMPAQERSESGQPRPRPPHDLRHVPIHANAEAKRLVAEEHSLALVKNGEIWIDPSELRPETTAGRRLLAHELAHVEQQRAGEAAEPIQRQEKKQQPRLGLGSAPPDIAYTRAEGPANEQEHVLFPYDSDKVSATERTKIESWGKSQLIPVIVELHGYASHEGPDEYNVNLSAHRAAAVKRVIEDALPLGSRVEVVARGESGSFEKPEENRRVGLNARMRPLELQAPPLLGGPGRLGIPGYKNPLQQRTEEQLEELDRVLHPPADRPPIDLTRPPIMPPGTWDPASPGLDFSWRVPDPIPSPNMFNIVGTFWLRNLPPTTRDVDTLTKLYRQNYILFRPLQNLNLPFYNITDEDIVNWSSSAAGAAAAFSLQRDYETGLEKATREGVKFGLPSPTVIPLPSVTFDFQRGAVDKSKDALKRWHDMDEEEKKKKETEEKK